jgi:hypothetical protein
LHWNNVHIYLLYTHVPESVYAPFQVSRCVDIGKYAMIGSSRRRCVGGEWDGQKPVCFGLNQENDYACRYM